MRHLRSWAFGGLRRSAAGSHVKRERVDCLDAYGGARVCAVCTRRFPQLATNANLTCRPTPRHDLANEADELLVRRDRRSLPREAFRPLAEQQDLADLRDARPDEQEHPLRLREVE
jgi:hypothetical protein